MGVEFLNRLFGTAGIRGRYLEKVSPELGYSLGLAIATLLNNKGSTVVGYDVRYTSQLLSLSVASGLMSGGVDVYSVGLVPTPVLAYSTVKLKADSGVMITASHNPPEDNGFKCFDSRGAEYTVDLERRVEELIGEKSYKLVDWDRVGKYTLDLEVLEEYVRDIVEKLKPSSVKKKFRVLIDPANGAASNVTPRILRVLGANVVSINSNPDGLFPGRHPEPRPDVLEELGRVVRSLNCSVAFAHDGDADRLAVLNSRGEFVPNDTLIAFYAKLKLSKKRGVVIVSVDVSKAVEEVVEELGGRVVRAKLGKTHEKLLEFKGKAVIAAEPWKLIDPEWGLWVDGIYQAALLTSLMLESGESIESLIRGIPRYPQERLSYKVKEGEKEEVYNKICEALLDEFKGYVRTLEIDGLKLEMPDNSWILVRKSGTEPKIRFYIEARSGKQLKTYVYKVEKIFSQAIKHRL